jgi:hypothetical protein
VVPRREDATVFDIKYFSRDTRRNPNPLAPEWGAEDNLRLAHPEAAARLPLPVEAVGPDGSQGRKDADVARYSADLLRSSMTASQGACKG